MFLRLKGFIKDQKSRRTQTKAHHHNLSAFENTENKVKIQKKKKMRQGRRGEKEMGEEVGMLLMNASNRNDF